MHHKVHHSEDEYDHIASGLIYCASSFPGSGVDMDKHVETQIEGCKCTEICTNDCTCVSQFGQPYQDGKLSISHTIKPIFECNGECSCDLSCPSQGGWGRKDQKGPLLGLEVLLFPEKGYGVKTSMFIPKYNFVCEYAGELISKQEAKIRFMKQRENESNYILVMREHFHGNKNRPQITIIDPTVIGNIGRYLNHSCNPNLMVVPVRINSMVPVAALFALRDIQPGEELCYDYDYNNSTSEILIHSQTKVNSLEEIFRQKSEDISGVTIASTTVVPRKDAAGSSGNQDLILNVMRNKQKMLKPCMCGSEKCRGFLPTNSVLF